MKKWPDVEMAVRPRKDAKARANAKWPAQKGEIMIEQILTRSPLWMKLFDGQGRKGVHLPQGGRVWGKSVAVRLIRGPTPTHKALPPQERCLCTEEVGEGINAVKKASCEMWTPLSVLKKEEMQYEASSKPWSMLSV